MFVCGQEFLCFKRGHTALSGRGHRLPIDVVGDIAGGEHAGHRGGVDWPVVTIYPDGFICIWPANSSDDG